MSTENPGKKTILIAEDDPIARRVLLGLLERWGYGVTAVENGADAFAALGKEDAPRLAVLDWMMPGLEGPEVCKKLRELKDHAYIYALLLSARTEKKDILAGLEAGADDYLTKPVDTEELRARLFVGERILNLQDELIAARDALRFQAMHDALTGLLNHGAILNAVTRELIRARREHASVGVILGDIDHFKQVNDTHGHLTGDAILHGVAIRMSGLLRAYDSLGRYGGEEFLILAPNSDSTGTMQFAERLRAGVEATAFETSSGTLHVSLSFGVAVSNPDDSPDSQALLQAADAALYRAKEAGRNRVVLAKHKDLTAQLAPASSAPVRTQA
ncbi:MAG TPA: diguanylate cyclase [Candidatus Acidoferrales bacterium]|nr:diguanylate cyclase [Candidatus Acidoferrales bacterium]